MLKQLISLILLVTIMTCATSCAMIKKDHAEPQDPEEGSGATEEETQDIVYVYSVVAKSIHLKGCYHTNEIKEDYKKEFIGDPPELAEKGYTFCKDCFPPVVEPEEPDEPEEPGISKEDATFLINKSTKKIHKLDCHYIEDMSLSNISYTDLTLEELLAEEHIPCASCMPDEWQIYKENHPSDEK